MKHAYKIRKVLLILFLATVSMAALSACNSGGDDSTNTPVYATDDDEDYVPDGGDDDADTDDDVNDDADDDVDDDLNDDVDDDADDDADDDVDDDVDDDDDDGTPVITITSPQSGGSYDVTEINIQARVENGQYDTIAAFLDSTSVTDDLTITEDDLTPNTYDITGVLDGVMPGNHNFRVEASNEVGDNMHSVFFTVNIVDPYLELTLSTHMAEPGDSVDAEVHVYDASGNEITGSYEYEVSPATGWTRDGDEFTFNEKGDYDITASAEVSRAILSDTESVEVKFLTPTSVEVHLSSTEIQAGLFVIANSTVYNADNEPLDGWSVDYFVAPGQGAEVDGNRITLTRAVLHTITGIVHGMSVSGDADCNVIPGPADDIELNLSQRYLHAGETITWSAEVMDAYGNVIDADATVRVEDGDEYEVEIVGDQITFNRARVDPFVVSVRYTILEDSDEVMVDDETEPRIIITSPERGHITQLTGINIQGQVIEDESSIDTFTINGQSVSYDPQGNFIHLVNLREGGLNIIEMEAVDEFGNTTHANISILRGVLLPDDTMIDNVVGIRVNDSGFDQIEVLAAGFIEEFDVASLIGEYLPMEIGSPGDSLYLYADYSDFSYDQPIIDIIPQWGGLALEATIPNLHLAGYVDVSISGGNPTRYDLEISGSAVTATARINITIDDEGGLVVEFSNFVVDLGNDFEISINGFSNAGLTAALETMINSMVGDLLNEELAKLIGDLLGDLYLGFEQELLGVNFLFELEFNELAFDNEGLILWMNGMAATDYIDPDTRAIGGSMWTASPPPDMETITPVNSLPYGFGAAIGDEFLNQALYQFYRAGLLTFHLDNEWAQGMGFDYELTIGDLSTFLPGLNDFFPDETPIEFWLNPQLPPVLVYSPDMSADAVTMELQIGDLLIDMMLAPDGQDPALGLSMALAMKIPVSAEVNTDTNSLFIELGEAEVSVDVIEELYVNIPDSLLEALMPLLLQLVTPMLADLLGEFPIPAFEGLTLEVIETSVFGYMDDSLGIFGDLIQAPPE